MLKWIASTEKCMAKAKPATAAQRRVWDRLTELGCIVCGSHVAVTRHHCGTGAGGRKNHDFVIPLCHYHHQGEMGIDRREYGATEKVIDWEATFGTEKELHAKAMNLIGMQ